MSIFNCSHLIASHCRVVIWRSSTSYTQSINHSLNMLWNIKKNQWIHYKFNCIYTMLVRTKKDWVDLSRPFWKVWGAVIESRFANFAKISFPIALLCLLISNISRISIILSSFSENFVQNFVQKSERLRSYRKRYTRKFCESFVSDCFANMAKFI